MIKINKIIYVGNLNSINLEIITKSLKILHKKRINFILVGNYSKIKKEISKNFYIEKITLNNFKDEFKQKYLNIFDTKKYKKIFNNTTLNDIYLSYELAKKYNTDLVTMPIDKYLIKKNNKFNGVTEFLGKINNSKTFMLMRGDMFSIIPITTHIALKDVHKTFINNLSAIDDIFINLLRLGTSIEHVVFLGLNPHSGEKNTLGKEEEIIKRKINILKKKYKSFKFYGPVSADSAFKRVGKNTLFISGYHDQALIPFKLINNTQINHTIGLEINRYSPAHGTARDIKYKNKADINSFIQCMII
mgnify:CR=1 FL=1